ncbi:hypothetical protein GUJ93_ZPchr0011g28751 [Zizania palustris]|uniref:Uncharacterized protein n=1 Tax=Zizania palustris TaxID=103762 RepID=A0A8J5WDC3_ZIZPA|nr:hypothetical protein GUJ93_ZPchr0011g28751 [Zizania palustris]
MEEDAGAKPTVPKPSEASSSSSSSNSSEFDSSSSKEDGGSKGDPRSDEEVQVVDQILALPKPVQVLVAEEIVRPLQPKGIVTEAAISNFREGCAAAEAGGLGAQLSH